jgi:hypothetical protein
MSFDRSEQTALVTGSTRGEREEGGRSAGADGRGVERSRRAHGPTLQSAAVGDRIVSLVPAEPGWLAIYRGEYAEDEESTRVIAWALVESGDGTQDVVGMVVAPDERTRIVSAPEGASAIAPEFDRYGFKGL